MPAAGDQTGRPASVRPAPSKKRPAPRPPSAKQIRQAKAQEDAYRSQGAAVKARAKAQPVESRAKAQEQTYKSQGQSVQKQANRQIAARKVANAETPRVHVDLGRIVRTATGARKSAPPGRGSSRPPGATIDQATLLAPSAVGTASRLGAAMGIALANDPGGTSLRTAKGFRDALTGIPSGLVGTLLDPLGTAKNAAGDYSRRYKDLNKPGGVEKTAKRLQKEGLAPELLDASGLLAAGGATVGRGLTVAAKAGKLGEAAERVATGARTAKRVSGAKSVEQRTSPNLIVAAGQKASDKRRVAKNQRKVARARDAGRPVDALAAEAAARGEVLPRRAGAAARKVVAQEKGRDLARMKGEQRTEVDRGTRREFAGLSKPERAGFKIANQLGIPADPAVARRAIEQRIGQIEAERQASGATVPKVRTDELAILRGLHKNADRVFTPRLAEVVRGEQARERRVAANDPALDPVQAQLRRHQPQAAFLGIKREEGESPASFLRRVKKDAAAAGLARPGYFHSQKRPRAGYSERALGGARAVAGTKAYTGALFAKGLEDASPLVHEQAIARGIKRKYNWNLVARQFAEHSFEWGRNQTVGKLLDEIDNRGLDPNSVALWNPRLYLDAAKKHEADGGDVTGRGEEPVVAGLSDAVDQSAMTIKDLATRPEDFLKTSGWTVIPKAVYDEIHAGTRPSGAIARGYDVVKGKQSRILLGLSPAWLQFQVASNAILTGLAGTGPVDFVKAQAWWNKLSDAEKAAVEPYIGVGHFHDSIEQTKLGAARTRSEKINQTVDAYRALKTTPFMQHIGRGNPLDMLFRADNAQNNAFRKAVLYSQIKRDAYKRMGQNAKLMAGVQTRFTHSLTLGPTEQMAALLRDHRSLERHAQHVADFLGDYSTYTARERRGFQRAVMFYGFLRFSLRFTFLTMPIKHPVMSSVIAQLGRLQADEVRKLLGGDELPWALGKLYFTKGGQLKSVDLSRANPTMNAVTNFRAPKDILGFLPPLGVALLDQAYSKTSFKDRPFRVRGENQGRKANEYRADDRARVFLNAMLSLAAPYRAAQAATQPGPRGDDALLFSPRPTGYRDPATVASINSDIAAQPKSVGSRLAQQFVPLIPRNDSAPELAASIRARNGGGTTAVVKRTPAPVAAARPADPWDAVDAALDAVQQPTGPDPWDAVK